jgi:hypothetical protein
MITVALVVAAALVLGGREILDRARGLLERLPALEIQRRHLAAGALILAAVVAYWQQAAPAPGPAPEPAPAGPLDLRGLFVGPTAAEDAATIAALCGELADEITWDGTQEAPYLKTGVAVDELRHRAREFRCRGVSIGARQPAARDAIAAHLERAVGVAGGPISEEQRAAWAGAFREIAEAAANVTK